MVGVAPGTQPQRSNWWLLGTIASGLAMLIYLMAWAGGAETGRGLIVGPIVLMIAGVAVGRIRREETDFDLAGIVFAAVGVKLLAVYGRFWMVDSLYNGVGDSTGYDAYGKLFAPFFRQLDFGVDPGRPIPGTGWPRVLTGVVYAIFGSDRFTGFIIFGMLSLIGCWFFYRAFSTAVPDGDHKRYALLVFFWPSVLFWPSAIGKEAWMIFSLGLASWGAAAIFRRRPYGFVLLGLGIAGAALPRPHIAIVVLAAAGVGLAAASLFGGGSGGNRVGFATKVIGVLFMLLAGAVLAPKVATFLNIDDVGGSGFTQTLDDVQERTSKGGSGFTPAGINSPLDYPWALVTVLFRPFLFEVSNTATLISALEGLMLMGMLALSAKRLMRLPTVLVQNAYVAYAAAFTFMFVYVFAFIANFGILARQRTQALPFLFVLFAISSVRERDRVDKDEPTPPSEPLMRPTPVLSPPRPRP